MSVAGSVHFPRDCHLSPNRFVTGLTRKLGTDGAAFSWQTEVTGWRTEGSRIQAVRTNRCDFSADEYVLAGGSWSPVVARDLRLKLLMQAGKGYSLTLPRPRSPDGLPYLGRTARVCARRGSSWPARSLTVP